jgi:hypothetical protein
MRQGAGDTRVLRGVRSAVSAASGAVVLACSLAACSSPGHFPGQLPNSGMFVTNVSSAKAFQDHDIKIPGDVSALSYGADSQLDGYPMEASFGLPCRAVQAFIKNNSLYQDHMYWDLPDQGVVTFAQQLGWRTGDRSTRWYQRPQGGNTNLEVIVSGTGEVCTTYLTALQG